MSNSDKRNPRFRAIPQEEANTMNNLQIVERAEGSYVWMEGDKTPYLDFVLGYSSANFGHMVNALKKVGYGILADNVVFFRSKAREELTEKLGSILGLDGEWYFYFPVGGAMAVEAAARYCLLGKPEGKLVSFKGGFHGYGGVSRALTDPDYLRLDSFVESMPIIRAPRPIDSGSVKLALKALEDIFKTSDTAGLFIEPVQGAAGSIDLGEEFLVGVRELCTKYDVVMVVDEIQTGLYRCGAMSLSLARSVVPDILLLGKSLGGGLAPISAVIISKKISCDIPLDGSGFDSTFSGWPAGSEYASAVLDLIKVNDFRADVKARGDIVDRIINQEFGTSDVRKRFRRTGLLIAYEAGSREVAENIRRKALDEHLIIQTSGVHGESCKFSPAINISPELLEVGLHKLTSIIKSLG